MDDKEMLEYAAKAIGIKLEWDGIHSYYKCGEQIFYWNSLLNDINSFQLMTVLKISIDYTIGGYLFLDFIVSAEVEDMYCEEDCELHCKEATRRAITRAAAQLGKLM